MGAVLVPVHLEEVERQGRLLSYAVTTAKSRVFLYLTGPLAAEDPTPRVLDYLAHCYDSVARLKPTFDVVPLFPCLGWTPERLAELPGVEEVVAAADHLRECHALLDKINAARERLQLPSLSLTLTAGGPEQAVAVGVGPGSGGGGGGAQQAAAQQPGQAAEGREGEAQGSNPAATALPEPAPPHSRLLCDTRGCRGGGLLRFKKVAVGGTFDRLHAGHRLLLAATALVSTGSIFVGVTGEKLLLGKKNADLLEPYEARAAAAMDYLRACNPGVSVFSGPLNDPNVPPIAATDPEFDAIVVSEETIPGAEAINRTRAQLGFQPLIIAVVGLVASERRAVKLSSTDLRLLDAERAGRA